MEDRYLCRAKKIDDGKWVVGNLIQSCDAADGWEAIIIPVRNSNMFTKHIGHGYGNLGFENWYRVDPSTICQFTGFSEFDASNCKVVGNIFDNNNKYERPSYCGEDARCEDMECPYYELDDCTFEEKGKK